VRLIMMATILPEIGIGCGRPCQSILERFSDSGWPTRFDVLRLGDGDTRCNQILNVRVARLN
jgi:hypothetical protein